MKLPPPEEVRINGSPCQHEIEVIYERYVMRDPLGSNFDQLHFVTGLFTSPFSLMLDVDESATITVSSLQHLRSGSLSSDSLGGSQFVWTSDAPLIASVINGIVTGVAAGSTTVRTKIASGTLPSGNIAGAIFGQKGQETSVVVPQPSGPFYVTAINVDQEPAIVTSGIHTFTAITTVPPPPFTSWLWTFVRSNTWPPDTTQQSGGATTTFDVLPGSYSLTVTANPSTAGPFTRSVNVCTEGGGGPEGPLFGGGIGTNKVAGC